MPVEYRKTYVWVLTGYDLIMNKIKLAKVLIIVSD